MIVGTAQMSHGRHTPGGSLGAIHASSTSGYTAELLPLLPGELRSLGTAINDAGQIVGARAGLFGLPSGFGWMYSDATGLVDLNAAYGWFATPTDINDAGVVLSGTQTLDLATGTVFDVGALDTTFGLISGEAINDAGQIVGLSTRLRQPADRARAPLHARHRLDVHRRLVRVHDRERHQQQRHDHLRRGPHQRSRGVHRRSSARSR